MMLADREANALLVELGARYGDTALANVFEPLRRRAAEWARSTRLTLAVDAPFAHDELAWDEWTSRMEKMVITEHDYLAAAKCYGEFCKRTGRPFEQGFWLARPSGRALKRRINGEQGDGLSADIERAAGLLQVKWREALDSARSEWELREIALRRDELRKELEAFLDLAVLLARQLEGLGLEPGVLLDLSSGQLSPQGVEQFKRWANYLANDEGVRALCDLLGKLRQLELSERVEQVKVAHMQEVWRPDPNSREEIIGVRLGRDLEHALPGELALLADPDTAILFDLKYVESRLMCFDMRGMQQVAEQHECEEERRFGEADKMGPMIICVDTSGSMYGMPETIAKAVTLFMAAKAREQNRACYLINFSTGIKTMDLSLDGGMDALIGFLKMSFHGGTDAAPALRHALKTMKHDAYAKADVLLISDFVMRRLPDDVRSDIEAQRKHGNHFYSLVVDEGFHAHTLSSVFDQEWIFDPRRGSIAELVDFQRRVEQGMRDTLRQPNSLTV